MYFMQGTGNFTLDNSMILTSAVQYIISQCTLFYCLVVIG